MEEMKKQPIYKKWWFWVIAVVLVLGIGVAMSGGDSAASGNPPKEENKTQEQSKGEAKPEETIKDVYAVGEEIKLGDNVLIVNKVTKSKGTEFDAPKDGHEYIIVDVTIKNGGKEEITYNPFDFSVQNSKGQITEMAFTIVDSSTALDTGKLASGGEVSGTVSFEQPKDDGDLTLIYRAGMFSGKEVKVKLK